MYLSEQVTRTIEMLAGNLKTVKPVSGGSINQSFQIVTDKGMYFLKTNSAKAFPDLFLSEVEGLRRIRKTNTIAVPGVVSHGRAGDEIFLILNWIEKQQHNSGLYQMGKQLAQMHKHGAEQFGLDHDNYMGALPQKNRWHHTWHEFFISERLEPQFQLGYDKHLIDKNIKNKFYALLTKLQALFPSELPSLVHGDLWSGNFIQAVNGCVLIDPAVFYGNREVDIAMSTLFGGFAADFYTGYQDEFPLQEGWEERLDIWNLYPLLVHLNMFGREYLPAIVQILNRFV